MIEIREKKECADFEAIIENEIISELYVSKEDEDDFWIELNREFDFTKLLERLGKYHIENLVYYNEKAIKFFISEDSDGEYYKWEKLFFPVQYLFIENHTIGFDFSYPEGDSFGWGYKYSPTHVLEHLFMINHEKVSVVLEDDELKIKLKKNFTTTLLLSYNELKKAIYEIEQRLYKSIEGFKWKEYYHTDEPKFTKEVMIPLLKKMKYKNVRYTHGVDEHGKDVIFSEINKFGEEIFYGVQVKAGDISGSVNSDINTLANQAKRAFTMPFKLLGEKNERHLSFFIIAISGHFTRTAKDVIVEQIDRPYKQNVFFWDKDNIEDLIGTYWKAD